MKKYPPKVSIIIPCRNEEKFIEKCIDSVNKQDYPKGNLEILVIDGASSDKTVKILQDLSKKNPCLKIFVNRQKFTPISMNIGVKNANGEIIARMDAHATYNHDYISKCVSATIKHGADNAGGYTTILPEKNTIIGRAIALSLSNRVGSAGAVYKTERKGKVKEVDTVFCGCFNKTIFDRIGYYNEKLKRTQDLELNIRIKKAGGKIVFDPSIKSYYYARGSLSEFIPYNLTCGEWAIYSWRITGKPLKLRQYVPFLFVSGVLFTFFLRWQIGFLSLLFYFLVLLLFSIKIALREGDKRLILPLTLVFACRHFSYGFGSFEGLIRVILQPLRKEF